MGLTALEFYAGIGGLHRGLLRSSQEATVIRAFDWDQNARCVYAANYDCPIEKTDISTLTAQDLASHQADIWLMSPACQPYTVLNPNARGPDDPRARSFLHLIRAVLPELAIMNKHPRYILIENVAGFETSTTRDILVSTLQRLDYNVLDLLLTPLQFGIPNSRLRYYLLAKLRPQQFARIESQNAVWRHIPGRGPEWQDLRRRVSVEEGSTDDSPTLNEFLGLANCDVTADPAIVIPDRVLDKWGRLFDVVLPSSQRTCCFTRGYTQLVERSGSVLQMNEDIDTTVAFDQFLAAQTAGTPNAVRLLDSLRLRYFSTDELLRLLCFVGHGEPSASGFVWPDGLTNKTKYRLLGNSVNVVVITELLNYLFE